MPNNNMQIPRHDRHIDASVENRSLLKELGKSAMDEYIVPKSTEILWNMFGSMINMFADVMKSSVGKLLYPDGNTPNVKTNNPQTGYYTNYTSYSTPIKSYTPSSQAPAQSIGQRPGNMVEYIWVPTEADAIYIRDTLQNEIRQYHKAKVASLYEILRRKTTMADFNYGWTKESDIGYYEDTNRAPGENRWFIDLARPVDITGIC